MKGLKIGHEISLFESYKAMMCDMMNMSIKHAHNLELSDIENTKKNQRIECYESRCYLLSNTFEQDCMWFDMLDDAAIAEVRKCKWSINTTWKTCIVCGTACHQGYFYDGRRFCWEHYNILQVYNAGRIIGGQLNK